MLELILIETNPLGFVDDLISSLEAMFEWAVSLGISFLALSMAVSIMLYLYTRV